AIACRSLLGADAGDLELGQRLTVPQPAVVAGLVLEVVDADLRALGLRDHLSGDLRLGQGVRVVRDGAAVDEQHGRQRDLGPGRDVELLDLDHIALSDLVLLAAGLDDGVHRGRLLGWVLTERPTSRWAVVQTTAPVFALPKRPGRSRSWVSGPGAADAVARCC